MSSVLNFTDLTASSMELGVCLYIMSASSPKSIMHNQSLFISRFLIRIDFTMTKEGRHQVHRAAAISFAAALLLTVMKLVIGLLSNSLGIMSEGLHSGLDMVAAGVTFLAVRSASQKPDVDHQFGHGKMENFAALVETILLWATAIWIFYEATRRIQLMDWAIPSLIGIVVMVISIVVNYWQSRLLYKTAHEHGSQALEADALHFRTDMLSSVVVLFGIVFVWFGVPIADSLSAIGVSIIIIIVSLQLGKRAFDVLTDSAPQGLRDEIDEICSNIPGVLECRRSRVRMAGPEMFIDVIVTLEDDVILSDAHYIATEIEKSLEDLAPEVDVIVHMEPASDSRPIDDTDLYGQIQRIVRKDKRIVSLHNIRIHDMADGIHLAADLEMESNIRLDTAHEVSESLEAELRSRIESIRTITFHLESSSTEEKNVDITRESGKLIAIVEQVVENDTPACDCHNIVVSRSEHGVSISFDCRIDGSMSLEDSHEVAVLIEKLVKEQVSDIESVFVHLEPL